MLLDELLYAKPKGDILSHAVHFELETRSSVWGVNILGIQQCSSGNLFVLSSNLYIKTKRKVRQTVTVRFLLGLVGTAGPQPVAKQLTFLFGETGLA